jgi:Nidogen-like
MKWVPSSGGRLRLAALGSALAAVMLLSTASSASAAGPNAVRNLPGCTTNTLLANDDGSTAAVPIGFTANFFGNEFTELFVNNNGNVTFTDSLGEFTPFDFTTTGDVIIAPFLADVDTGGAPGDGSKEVTYGTDTLNGNAVFCVNWVDVGYFSQHVDKTNSFQLLLIDQGSGNFNIEFNYDRVSWETGDASGGDNGFGGTSAAVGWASGDGDPLHSFFRDGSFENGALLDSGPKALIAGMQNSGGQFGRYVFNVNNPPPTGSTLTGEVTAPASTGGDPISRAPVEICRSGGSCISRFTDSNGVYRAINLIAGTYTVTAHSGGPGSNDETEYADGVGTPSVVSGAPGASFTQDVVLGEPLGGPPPGTTIEGIGESPSGVPTLFWSDPAPLSTEAPAGCIVTSITYTVTVDGSVVQSGALTEDSPGVWTATIPPLIPASGQGVVDIIVNGSGTCDDIEFAIYIDPSGVVRNAATGALIEGAQVTLFRSSDSSGPFVQVPDGSATMAPGNRNNPDLTDSNGHFGWDVIAGFYKVVAEAPGCTPASTGVLSIPPPVTDLDIGLSCPTSGGGGGGGGGAPAQQFLTAPPKAKKCKKKKGKKAAAAKKCKKKKKRSAAAASNPFEASGLLFIGSSEPK